MNLSLINLISKRSQRYFEKNSKKINKISAAAKWN